MIIRPVTDLRNHFPDVESALMESGAVYLTKNGYGAAVLLSIAEYMELVGKHELPAKAKASAQAKKVSSDRGALHKYANPDLISLEKNAGRMHAAGKFGKVRQGKSDEE